MPSKKRQKVARGQSVHDLSDDMVSSESHSTIKPATREEKKAWQGWCEIESNPAFFNVLLKDFGVQGVKVMELLGLDDELLAMLPKPVYGLIFLFHYREHDVHKQEATCPEHVWFANQVTIFDRVKLSDNLQNFKNFTSSFPPALRGDQIDNFGFVKTIHNSFARKLDIFSIDHHLQTKYQDRNKRARSGDDDGEDDENQAFHFIAYMPIQGEVWKLDGLDRQPQRLGKFPDEDWLSVVKPILEDRMATYEAGEIQFALLGLVKDPLLTHQEHLAANIRTRRRIEQRLKEIESVGPENQKEALKTQGQRQDETQQASTGLTPQYGVTEAMIEQAEADSTMEAGLIDGDIDLLREMREKVMTQQSDLRASILEEMQEARADEQQAAERRHDYGPMIQAWVRMLAEKEDLMKELVQTYPLSRGKE